MDFHFHHIRDLPRIRHISLTTTKSTGLVTNWLDCCNSLQYTKELSRLYCVRTAFQIARFILEAPSIAILTPRCLSHQIKTIHSKIACTCNASAALLGYSRCCICVITSQDNSGHLPCSTFMFPITKLNLGKRAFSVAALP